MLSQHLVPERAGQVLGDSGSRPLQLRTRPTTRPPQGTGLGVVNLRSKSSLGAICSWVLLQYLEDGSL